MLTFSFIQTLLACVPLCDATTTTSDASGGDMSASLPPVPSYLKSASRATSVEEMVLADESASAGGAAMDCGKELTDAEMKEQDAQLYQTCWRVSSDVSSWSIELLKRLLPLVEFYASKGAGLAAMLKHASSYMVMVMIQLFEQMSASKPLHAKARGLVFEWVTGVYLPDGAKPIAHLMSALARSRPVEVLEMMVPHLHGKMTSDGGRKLGDLSDGEMAWNLRLLDGCVRRTGTALLVHKSKIEQILSLTLDHDDKKVRKTACKLLRHTLQSLLQHYTLESESYKS